MYAFRLIIKDREYKGWEWEPKCIEEEDKEKDDTINTIALDPGLHKLFHNDIVDQGGSIIKKSPYRDEEIIHGILITTGKTYGRLKDSKLLYQCIPDDKTLPHFLVPFEEKNIGFHKNKKDKYITFRIKEWVDKHPIGILTNNYGDVDTIENYTTYKMSCKKINDSLQQFNKIIVRSLRETTLGKIPYFCNDKPIEDRRTYQIISIDPKECNDIDDALGILTLNGQIQLSIYISNVPMMMEYLNLWEYITNRISTIYLPDKKLPMLPSILSDNVCSLKEGEDRVAFVLDVFINVDTYEIVKVNHATVIIKVEKNYVYETRELLHLEQYHQLKNTVIKLNQQYKNVNYMDKILNSHDVVEYCMLLMNHECAKMLLGKSRGIFRSTTKKEKTLVCKETPYPHLNYILQTISGEYCSLAKLSPHYIIAGGIQCYTHITSPIRRMVDCVMMLELQQQNFKWSDAAITFLNKWTTPESIDTINRKTKVIRKLENEIRLLELYTTQKEVATHVYGGIVFGKTSVDHAGKTMYKYNVYIQPIKFLSSLKTEKELVDYTMVDVSIHQFLDEAKMCKKIRLQLA